MTRKHAKFLPLAVAATVAAALQIYPAGVFLGFGVGNVDGIRCGRTF